MIRLTTLEGSRTAKVLLGMFSQSPLVNPKSDIMVLDTIDIDLLTKRFILNGLAVTILIIF